MKLTTTHYIGIALAIIIAFYYFKRGTTSDTASGAKNKRIAGRTGYPKPRPSTARRQNMGWSFSSCHSIAFWNNFFNPNNMELQQSNCKIYYG